MGKVLPPLPPIPRKLVIQKPSVDFVSGSAGSEVMFTVSGLQAMSDNISMLGAIARDAAGYEMAAIAREIIIDAQENYVPELFGHLIESGDSDEYLTGTGITIAQIAMWFGAPVSPEALGLGAVDVSTYALEQHENMNFRHPAETGVIGGSGPGTGTGGPKYLERPFMVKMPTIAPRIAKAIASACGEGGGMNPAFVTFALT